MSKKTIKGAPVFGPKELPKQSESDFNGMTPEFFHTTWIPMLHKMLAKEGGMQAFLSQNPELRTKIQALDTQKGAEISTWVHKHCPTQEETSPEEIRTSFQQALAPSSTTTSTSNVPLAGQESSEVSDS